MSLLAMRSSALCSSSIPKWLLRACTQLQDSSYISSQALTPCKIRLPSFLQGSVRKPRMPLCSIPGTSQQDLQASTVWLCNSPEKPQSMQSWSTGGVFSSYSTIPASFAARKFSGQADSPEAHEVSTAKGPLLAYHKLIQDGHLKDGDPAQERAAKRLQTLYEELGIDERESPSWRLHLGPLRRLAGWQQQGAEAPKGLYLYGGVGTGKTMLMDVFFQGAPTAQKLRVHFHKFMLDMHARLHKLQTSYAVKLRGKDPVAMVGEQLAEEYRLLCLDEIEVTDIADALILLRIFQVLWPRGLVLVATSNSKPEELYKGGLNHQLFEPFFELLHKYCNVLSLDDGRDYREGLTRLKLFIHPADDIARQAMDEAFRNLTEGTEVHPKEVEVMMGRKVNVQLAGGQVARLSFSEVCGKPLGAADYIALAQEFEVFLIDDIPWLGDPAFENMARRFVNLIDILYESGKVLVGSAAVPLELLFASDLAGEQEEAEVEDHAEEPEASTIGHKSGLMRILGEGGSSGRSTTMVGEMEWSGTGRSDASLAQLAGHGSFTKVATRRTQSRLVEMQSATYIQKNRNCSQHAVDYLTRGTSDQCGAEH